MQSSLHSSLNTNAFFVCLYSVPKFVLKFFFTDLISEFYTGCDSFEINFGEDIDMSVDILFSLLYGARARWEG